MHILGRFTLCYPPINESIKSIEEVDQNILAGIVIV